MLEKEQKDTKLLETGNKDQRPAHHFCRQPSRRGRVAKGKAREGREGWQ
jgi:hypothetical protein